ncbi:MAG: ATP-binding protein [Phaeodactylibacter sp.]|nr:ATP-binding protein [Phaeodactylibacter sp.]
MSQPKPNISKRFRYPGIQPFSTEQSDTFFGREEETAALYRLIQRTPLVVLHGKSGYGKSSLLNAGIIPLCHKESIFGPILIRFGTWAEGVTEMLLDIAKNKLAQDADRQTILSQLLPGDDSLWRYAKAQQLSGGGRPLLLFDQFEELFTYPEEAAQAFQQELAELLAPAPPLRYLRRLEAADAPELSEAEEDLLEAPLEARIVIAVRSDRLHLLGQLAGYLPNVLHNLFELRALRPADAKAAIVRPAGLPDAHQFFTPPFSWTPAALEKMMAFLQDEEDENRVESILLQMICQYLEEKKVQKEGLSQLDAADLGNLKLIVNDYYVEKLNSLENEAELHAARRLIEEGLVMEGEKIRLSLHEAQIEKQFGVGVPLLNRLVDSRLLRAEPFLRGGYTYELAHDRLVEPVLKEKQKAALLPPIIDCHTHIFTGDHVPPYLTKTFVWWPFYYLINLPLILWAVMSWNKWGDKIWFSRAYRAVRRAWYKAAIQINRVWALSLLRQGIVALATVHVFYILYDWLYLLTQPEASDANNWMLAMRQQLESWNILFPINNRLVEVLLVLFFLLSLKTGRNFIFSVFKRLWSFFKLLPGSMTTALIERYISMGRFILYRHQHRIMAQLRAQYPPGTGFVVLPMDMEYMEAGKLKPKGSFYRQMEELARVKNNNDYKDIMFPFVFVDPRRITSDPGFFRYTFEGGKVSLE